MKKLYAIKNMRDVPDTVSQTVRRRFLRDDKRIDVCADDKGKLYFAVNVRNYDVQRLYIPITQSDPCIFFQKVDLYTEQIQFLKANFDGNAPNFSRLEEAILKHMPCDNDIYRVLIAGNWGFCDVHTSSLYGVYCNAKLVKEKTTDVISYPVGERLFGNAIENNLGYLVHSPGCIFI